MEGEPLAWCRGGDVMCDGGRENSCTVHTTLVFIVGKVVLLLEYAYILLARKFYNDSMHTLASSNNTS